MWDCENLFWIMFIQALGQIQYSSSGLVKLTAPHAAERDSKHICRIYMLIDGLALKLDMPGTIMVDLFTDKKY